MKIMLDTNVLISALVFGRRAGKLLNMLFESEHELYVSEYIDQEFQEKLKEKWPAKAERVYDLYRQLDIRLLWKGALRECILMVKRFCFAKEYLFRRLI